MVENHYLCNENKNAFRNVKEIIYTLIPICYRSCCNGSRYRYTGGSHQGYAL